MIIIEDKTQQKPVYFPKEKNSASPSVLRLFCHLSKNEYTFDISRCTVLDLYYVVSIDWSNLNNGEYDYTIYDIENNVLQNGVLRVGKIESGDLIYDFKEEYVVYNPETGESEIIEYGDCTDAVNEAYRQGYSSGYTDGYEEGSESGQGGYESGYTSGYTDGFNSGYSSGHTDGYQEGYNSGTTDGFNSGYTSGYTDGYSSGYTDGYEKGQEECGGCGWVSVRTPFNIPASATQINYEITANQPFDMTAYVMNWISGDWAQYAPTIHSETSPYTGTLQIPANESSGVMEYMIAAGLDDECATHYEAYVIQAPASDTPVPPTPPTPSGYTDVRFSIEMLEDGDIEWAVPSLYYDIIRNGQRDAGYQLDHSILGLLAGDVVEFYVASDITSAYFVNHPINSSARHITYGNVMSLYYVDFEDKDTLLYNQQFMNLFQSDSGLVDAENLILPATNTTEGCYMSMFAYTLIEKAPVILANSLATRACWSMFYGCSNLKYIKCLATDISSYDCTRDWVKNVSATGTFVKDANMSSWTTGNYGIPSGWTVISE